MAWAWGVSRIIDALEVTPAARINPTKVGVTGCSRNGKGALVAGAFDTRIALTIPQGMLLLGGIYKSLMLNDGRIWIWWVSMLATLRIPKI